MDLAQLLAIGAEYGLTPTTVLALVIYHRITKAFSTFDKRLALIENRSAQRRHDD